MALLLFHFGPRAPSTWHSGRRGPARNEHWWAIMIKTSWAKMIHLFDWPIHSELRGSDLIKRGTTGGDEVITDTGLPPLLLLLGSLARQPRLPPGKFTASLRTVRISFSAVTSFSWKASGSRCKNIAQTITNRLFPNVTYWDLRCEIWGFFTVASKKVTVFWDVQKFIKVSGVLPASIRLHSITSQKTVAFGAEDNGGKYVPWFYPKDRNYIRETEHTPYYWHVFLETYGA